MGAGGEWDVPAGGWGTPEEDVRGWSVLPRRRGGAPRAGAGSGTWPLRPSAGAGAKAGVRPRLGKKPFHVNGAF